MEAEQSGTLTIASTEWNASDSTVRGWLETTGEEVLGFNRTNAAVPEGDTAYFNVNLNGDTDTLTIKTRLVGIAGGTTLDFTITGAGFSIPYFNDGLFHEVQTNLAGKDVVLKFKADNDDSNMNRNIRFAIHDLPVYELDQADFENPNVLNAMFYNIQMISFGVSGMPQASDRAALLPAQISEFQDVVCYAEAFDDGPRENDLIPAMETAGFPYRTEILNQPGGIVPFPVNGGVIIFSRWPIEAESEINFAECGQAAQDCLANKGVKYARVNKLGKPYHVFGTHMDAGGGTDDIYARRTQMAEIRDFIANSNIPENEPVIIVGDFNTAPTDSDDDYQAFLDTMSPIIPQHIGYFESNFSDELGNIIDHAWGDRTHLVPVTITNELVTIRSLDPVLWDISEFSDHRSNLGRYEYPDISKMGGDTLICPGQNLTLSVSTGYPVNFQWLKDGVELNGETNSELQFINALESQSGTYSCLVSYDVLYGDWGDTLTTFFYPNGPETVEARLNFEFGDVVIDDLLCRVGVEDYENSVFTLFPNPANDALQVTLLENLPRAQMLIYDTNGKQVFSNFISNQSVIVDLSQFSSGLYFMELKFDQKVFHERFVIR